MPENQIRIFISSPGDVVEERNQAKRVIERLQQQYPDVVLEPVLWEEMALEATESFQVGIDRQVSGGTDSAKVEEVDNFQETVDFIVEKQPIDIAVFILWSRLGSPLEMKKPDGTHYRSGTEREFDLMLAAFEKSGKERPKILAYVREDDTGFRQRLTESYGISQLDSLIEQRKLTEAFVQEQFHDEDGRNQRAYFTYKEPVGFADRLRVHLQNILNELVESDQTASWLENPYRGLRTFGVQHAPIFRGRGEEVCDVMQRLRDQQTSGCGFVVIVGASGSGKSSLAQAGVAASLLENGSDEKSKWLYARFAPSESPENLIVGVLNKIYDLLGNETTVEDIQQIADGLVNSPDLTMKLGIAAALKTAAADLKGQVPAILVVLDQLEELWTDRRISAENREQFLLAIKTLASCDQIIFLATLRSDFYPQAQRSEAFLQLKGDRGHFDLLPPGHAAMSRMITEPGRLAGLRFEYDEQTGKSLDQIILDEAVVDAGTLPLLQFALDELFRLNDKDTRTLTFASYNQLGGVIGALGKRAESVFTSLPAEAQKAFAELLPLLVSFDIEGDQTAVRRWANLEQVKDGLAQQTLTDALIESRFLTVDSKSTGASNPAETETHTESIASFSHEAILTQWDRVSEWIRENREHLKLRSRIEQSHQRWEESGQDPSLLLAEGWPLEEGRELLRSKQKFLSSETQSFIRQSISEREQQQDRRRRRTRLALATISLLAILASIAAIIANQFYRDSQSKAVALQQKSNDLQNANVELAIANKNLTSKENQLEKSLTSTEAALARTNYFFAKARWGASRVLEANEFLDEVPLRYRHFEWHLAKRQFRGSYMTCYGHKGWVESVSFSPDGRWIVSGSNDKTIKIWDDTTGAELQTLRGHAFAVRSVAFSPNGRRIVSGSDDNTLKIWDVTSGAELQTLRGHIGGVNNVAFSPNGRRIVSGSNDETIKIWDATTGAELKTLRGHVDDVFSVAFSPDGKQIVSGTGHENFKTWDATSGAELQTLKGHTSTVVSVAFSPDGRRIASGSNDNTIKVWDSTGGAELQTLKGHTSTVVSVAFSPDGRRIVSGSRDNTIKVWDATSGAELHTLRGHIGWVRSVAFSPDGRRIVSGSYDDTIKVWDTTSSALFHALAGDIEGVTSVAFSPDGQRIALGVWENTIKILDAPTGAEIQTLEGHTSEVISVTFSPDGRRIVSGSDKGTIKIWDAATGAELQTFRGHTDYMTSVACSPNGQRIVSGSYDETIKIWDVTSGAELHTLRGHTDYVRSVSFSPDGRRIVSGSDDETIKIWDATSGAEIQTLRGHTAYVRSVSFSPDGRWIVSGSDDETIKIWDVTSGAELHTLKGHTRSVRSLSFSPDGQRIVSGSDDKMLIIWDVTSGTELHTLKGHTDNVTSVAFSPDGRRIVSGSDGETII